MPFMNSPDIIDFGLIPKDTDALDEWLVDQLNIRSLPTPGDVGGWKLKDWVAFAIEYDMTIQEESQHCRLLVHPYLGVVGSFAKTPSDHRSYKNAMADIRRNIERHRQRIAGRILDFQGRRNQCGIGYKDDDGNVIEINLSAMERGQFFDLFVRKYEEVVGETDELLTAHPDTVRSFLQLALKIQRKFGIHPRALMNQTQAVDGRHIEHIVEALRQPLDDPQTIYMAAEGVTDGGLEILELYLQELEDEKQAKRERRFKGRPSEPAKPPEPDRKDLLVADLKNQINERSELLVSNLKENIKVILDSMVEVYKNLPSFDMVERLVNENRDLKAQIEEQAREIVNLRKGSQ